MPTSLVDAAETLRAQAAQAPAAERGRTALLVCRVGGAWLAFEASHVQAILETRAPSPVPHTPPHVLGVISHGESALAVVDLASFFRLDGERAGGESARNAGEALGLERIVVASAGGLTAGLRCEKVAGVREVGGAFPPPHGVLQGERIVPFLVAELPRARGGRRRAGHGGAARGPAGEGMSAGRGCEVALATSQVGPYALALPLEQIAFLTAWDDLLDLEDEACLDLGRLLGAPSAPQGRRVAGLAGKGRELYVVLGEAVTVKPVELLSVHPLPAILAGAGQRFGCAGLVQAPEGFCFLLDAERLRGVSKA
ncbi:MAG: chemotaxis protein CheW [Myxococcales bacterium]